MKNGTIMILAPDKKDIGRKVFDLKIIQSFPIITTDANTTKLITENGEENIMDYQHLSIPPDLNLHLTKSSGKDRHLNFDINLVNGENGTINRDFVRLFTWCSSPINNYKQPIGKWFQAQIICLGKDSEFTDNTGVFIDFFVHKTPQDIEKISQTPYRFENMRFVGDRHGNIIGPYKFNEIVRGHHKIEANYFFTIRFGYAEIHDQQAVLDVPFRLKS